MKDSPAWPPVRLEPVLLGPVRAALLEASLATGILPALSARSGRISSLARRSGLELQGAELLLDGLAELGLARQHAGIWSLTPRSRRLMVDPGLSGLAGALDLVCGLNWKLFPLLARAARKGGPVIPPKLIRVSQPRRLAALGALAAAAVPAVAAALRKGLRGRAPRRWFDVGAGSGQLSLGLLRRFPRAQAVLLDRPEVVRAVRQAAAGVGSARIRWHSGDFENAPWGRDYDAVLLSQVLAEVADLDRLLERVVEALQPDGLLVIHDTFAGRGGFSLALRALLLLNGPAQPPSPSELARALRAHRFQLISRGKATRWTSLWLAKWSHPRRVL